MSSNRSSGHSFHEIGVSGVPCVRMGYPDNEQTPKTAPMHATGAHTFIFGHTQNATWCVTKCLQSIKFANEAHLKYFIAEITSVLILYGTVMLCIYL